MKISCISLKVKDDKRNLLTNIYFTKYKKPIGLNFNLFFKNV